MKVNHSQTELVKQHYRLFNFFMINTISKSQLLRIVPLMLGYHAPKDELNYISTYCISKPSSEDAID